MYSDDDNKKIKNNNAITERAVTPPARHTGQSPEKCYRKTCVSSVGYRHTVETHWRRFCPWTGILLHCTSKIIVIRIVRRKYYYCYNEVRLAARFPFEFFSIFFFPPNSDWRPPHNVKYFTMVVPRGDACESCERFFFSFPTSSRNYWTCHCVAGGQSGK